MIYLSDLIAQEVDTEKVQDGAKDLVCGPEWEPASLVNGVGIIVEYIWPGHKGSQE